jgi:hypothetical protein
MQIGPLRDMRSAMRIRGSMHEENIPYTYVLLGALGSTLNSRDEALEPAAYLMKYASRTHVITSANTPMFTSKGISLLPRKLQKAVTDVGFRNTVGRAAPKASLRHLCMPGGANYKSVKALYGKIKGKNLDEIQTRDLAPFFKAAGGYMRMPEDQKGRNTMFKLYLRTKGQNVNVNVKCSYKDAEIVVYEQIISLARMLYALHDMFETGKDVILSDTIIKFAAGKIQNNRTGIAAILEKAQTEYFKHMSEYTESIPMTPAYDLAAGMYVVQRLLKRQGDTNSMPNTFIVEHTVSPLSNAIRRDINAIKAKSITNNTDRAYYNKLKMPMVERNRNGTPSQYVGVTMTVNARDATIDQIMRTLQPEILINYLAQIQNRNKKTRNRNPNSNETQNGKNSAAYGKRPRPPNTNTNNTKSNFTARKFQRPNPNGVNKSRQ